MIKDFVQQLIPLIENRDDVVFITGDVGHISLDPIKAILQDRFINAGIAEQNMINVAAGMAEEGFKVYVYTIAPFLYLRAYEQIKLNIASKNLPVTLLANGGGYGYGVMGPTHHALNDLSLINSIENIQSYVPTCSFDTNIIAKSSLTEKKPQYIRLGLNSIPIEKHIENGFGAIKISKHPKTTVLTLGPLAVAVLENKNEIDHFSCFSPSFQKFSNQFIKSVETTGHVIIIEEHVATGGIGEKIMRKLQLSNMKAQFTHLYANHYQEGHGDQNFYRSQNSLDPISINAAIDLICKS